MVVRSIIIVEQVLYFQVNDFDEGILCVLAELLEGFEQEFLCHFYWVRDVICLDGYLDMAAGIGYHGGFGDFVLLDHV